VTIAAGILAGNYLADHSVDKKIAILHDDTTFGKGVADLTKEQLNRRGLSEVIYHAYVPGGNDYAAEITELQAADIDVVFIGGYATEVALMARAAGGVGYPVQLVTRRWPDGRGFWPDRRGRGRGDAVR
jgi:branched-chain amino acid transport system substrate-binding protein